MPAVLFATGVGFHTPHHMVIQGVFFIPASPNHGGHRGLVVKDLGLAGADADGVDRFDLECPRGILVHPYSDPRCG